MSVLDKVHIPPEGDLSRMALNDMIGGRSIPCSCGRVHETAFLGARVEQGALEHLPEELAGLNAAHPFLLADRNTWRAAGERAVRLLEEAGIPYGLHVYEDARLAPNEEAVGKAVCAFSYDCDSIVAVGGGTLNDIGKMISGMTRLPYLLVATAPSMDGFASGTSSMIVNGLKVSLPSRSADRVIADTDILSQAPAELLRAGLGDLLAKYISIPEWKIASLICGDVYCANIAKAIQSALAMCVPAADLLMERDPGVIGGVTEGLILTGIAMNFAGCSRPASGMEHYYSHLWDMTALNEGRPEGLHGLQCAVGTVESLKVYEQVLKLEPNRRKGMDYARNFRKSEWKREIRKFLGRSAESMIALEEKEQKYAPDRHAQRLERVIAHWDDIRTILQQDLPERALVEDTLRRIGAPVRPADLGYSRRFAKDTFRFTKDVRDKYIGSTLLWDIGELDHVAEIVYSV